MLIRRQIVHLLDVDPNNKWFMAIFAFLTKDLATLGDDIINICCHRL